MKNQEYASRWLSISWWPQSQVVGLLTIFWAVATPVPTVYPIPSHLYELTCPAERNIDARNLEKSNKYAHFTTDITHLSCKVNCFEVSTKGFLNTRNHSTLNTLHKFVKQSITKSQFKSNISAISLTASYHIFLCKDEPTFLEPPYLLPPLVTKKAIAST